VLRSNIINYSRDFPYVWDEVEFNVANESDLEYTARVIEDTARRVLGPEMVQAASEYQALLDAQRLPIEVEELPRVYLSLADSWTDCTLRYLIPVRSRRTWASTLTMEITKELSDAKHRGRIVEVYPRHEVALKKDWSAPAAEQ
jgi:small-conductance mechanosensitive channel